MSLKRSTPHINWYILLSAALSMAFSLAARGKIGLNVLNLLHVPLITLVPAAAYLLTERKGLRAAGAVGLTAGAVPAVFIMAPGVWALSQAFGTIADNTLSRYGVQTPNQVDIPTDFMEAALSFFVVCAIAPVCEEFFYRGVVLHAFEGFGPGGAVFCSAFLFALAHYSPSLSAVAFVFGIFTGYVVVKTGSIIAGVLLHMACNALSYALMLINHGTGAGFRPLFYAAAALALPIGLLLLKNQGRCMSGGHQFVDSVAYMVLNLPFILLIALYIFSIPFAGG